MKLCLLIHDLCAAYYFMCMITNTSGMIISAGVDLLYMHIILFFHFRILRRRLKTVFVLMVSYRVIAFIFMISLFFSIFPHMGPPLLHVTASVKRQNLAEM